MATLAAEGVLPQVSLRERFIEKIWGQRARNFQLKWYFGALVVTAVLWHFREPVDPYLARLHWVPGVLWLDANPLAALLLVSIGPPVAIYSFLAWFSMPVLVGPHWNKLRYYAVMAVAPAAFFPMWYSRAFCPLLRRDVVYDDPPQQTQQHEPSYDSTEHYRSDLDSYEAGGLDSIR